MDKSPFWWLVELYRGKGPLKPSEIELAWLALEQGEDASELESACDCLTKLAPKVFDAISLHKYGLTKPRNVVRVALLNPMVIRHYIRIAHPDEPTSEVRSDLLMFEHALRFAINLIWRQARGVSFEQA